MASILLWLAVINALTVLAFWVDKRIAQESRQRVAHGNRRRVNQQGGRRVSESSLLTLAIIGGSPGAMFARQLFRHKTRKQPFSGQLHLICVLQLVAVIGVAVTLTRS